MGVEERLGARAVDPAGRRRPGQFRQLGAVGRVAPPQVGAPQFHREQRPEIPFRRVRHERVREVVARAAGVVGPGEHHLGGDDRARRPAHSVAERDRVGLRVIGPGGGQQPARRFVDGPVLDLAHHRRRDARRDRVELVPAVPGEPVFAGGVIELLKCHVSLSSPEWPLAGRGSRGGDRRPGWGGCRAPRRGCPPWASRRARIPRNSGSSGSATG